LKTKTKLKGSPYIEEDFIYKS